MSRAASGPTAEVVHVWHAVVDEVFGETRDVDRALEMLQPGERERYERYRLDIDRRMFLLGRTMARELVGAALAVRPADWQWREGPHGRPEIAGPATTLRFNLAHSAGLVVCALADGREVGTDVEDLARPPSDRNMVRRFCAPEEVADIEAQGAAWRDRFLIYWTLKEAYLKARGVGISVHLSDISFTLEPAGARIWFLGSLAGAETRWAFHLVRPTDRHLVAIAASTADGVTPSFLVERWPRR